MNRSKTTQAQPQATVAAPPPSPPPPPSRLLDRRELAEYLRLHDTTIDRMVRIGMPFLDASATSSRYRKLRFDVAQVLAWMAERAREVRR